jgi:hypothetical protein
VAQLVEALHYKPEGRRFDSQWCRWNFSLTYSIRPHCDPRVVSASNRNSYHKYFLGGLGGLYSWAVRRADKLTTFMYSTNCLEVWDPQPPGILRACQGLEVTLELATKAQRGVEL